MEALAAVIRRAMDPIVVSRIETSETVNRDESAVLWVKVLYVDCPDGPSVETMRTTTNVVWSEVDIERVTPVVSFVADEDTSLEAAE